MEVLTFLNSLRESGQINMFGAAPYIEDTFEVERAEAVRLLTLWMKNFNEEGDYQTIQNC